MQIVDLSHDIFEGLETFKGLPAPIIGEYKSRLETREHYQHQAEFHLGKIEMSVNTGTYLDVPFHRDENGMDLAEFPIDKLAYLPAIVVKTPNEGDRIIDRKYLTKFEIRGKAVLIHTGWGKFWDTPRYFESPPFVTAAAAEHLVEQGITLLGIDATNVDDMKDMVRPVHTQLLRAGIPIVENLCHLEELTGKEVRFTAVPPKIKGLGSFPVRAFGLMA